MKADYVVYDEHASYRPGRRKQKAAGRFILRTHIENHTPYRTSDLVAIVHAAAAGLHDAKCEPFLISELHFRPGTPPKASVRIRGLSGDPDDHGADIFLPSTGCTSAEVVSAAVLLFSDCDELNLRERTRRMRQVYRRSSRLLLRRRRGKRQ